MNLIAIIKESNYDREVRHLGLDTFNRVTEPGEIQRLLMSRSTHLASVQRAKDLLAQRGDSVIYIERKDLKKNADLCADVVVAIGGDGTFLESAQYISHLPMIIVNSDPKPGGSIGFYSAATVETLPSILENFTTAPRTTLPRVVASVNGVEGVCGVNEILLGYPRLAGGITFTMSVDGADAGRLRGKYGLFVTSPQGSTAAWHQIDGNPIPIGSNYFGYHVNGIRGSPFLLARHIRTKILCLDAEVAADSHYRRELTKGDVVDFTLGAPITIIGNITQKQQAFVESQQLPYMK